MAAIQHSRMDAGMMLATTRLVMTFGRAKGEPNAGGRVSTRGEAAWYHSRSAQPGRAPVAPSRCSSEQLK